jgi:polyisoprenoid-binding protein YceI
MSRLSRTVAVLSILSLSAAGLVAMTALAPSHEETPVMLAGEWKVDPVHSFVVFRVRHNNVANAYGMFIGPTGSFTIDGAKPESSVIEVTVQAEKVSTGVDKRDDHLRSPDFLNAREFPTITFRSTSFKSAGENAYDVTGDLTFLGQTRPVTARLHVLGTGKGQRGEVMGAEATFTIRRSDFGNKFMVGPLGDEVHLTVALEAQKNAQ